MLAFADCVRATLADAGLGLAVVGTLAGSARSRRSYSSCGPVTGYGVR